jgi:5-methylthioadenosine/S-adenosylhomocysteine deaminase
MVTFLKVAYLEERQNMKKLFKDVKINNEIKDLLVIDNKIAKISTSIPQTDCQIYHADKKIILPSFANGHTHAAMTLLRGYADDLDLFDWLSNYIWPLEAKLTEDHVYWGTRLACLEMIKTGTSCFNDMYWHSQASAQAVKDSGIRAILSQVFIDNHMPQESKKQIKKAEIFFQINQDSERIHYALGPHAIYTVSEESLVWIKSFAQNNDRLIHIHVAETKKEVEDCQAKHGMTPIEYLSSLGLLSERSLLAHCVWLTDRDIELIADSGASILHNPSSNLKLASGYFPLKKLKDKGVRIALSTDGCSSNNNLSILEEMKFAALVPKYLEMDPKLYPADQVFHDATASAFAALRINAGKIEEGKLADFILIDENFLMTPNYNTISNLVYSADSSCVDSLVCNGKVIMNKKKVKDEELILQKVNEISKKLTNK